MELERYLENGVQSTSFHSEEAEKGFATCLRWHSLLGTWLVQEPGASGLDHYMVLRAPWVTEEIQDQTFTSILLSVLGRKRSEQRDYYRLLGGCEEEYRWTGEQADKRDLEWDFKTYQNKGVLWQHHRSCVFLSLFSEFSPENTSFNRSTCIPLPICSR